MSRDDAHDAQELRSKIGAAQRAITLAAQRRASPLSYTRPDLRPNPKVEPEDRTRVLFFALSVFLLLMTSFLYASDPLTHDESTLLSTTPVQVILLPALALFLIASVVFAFQKSQLSARRQRNVTVLVMIQCAAASCMFTLSASFLPGWAFAAALATSASGLACIHQMSNYTARTTLERVLTDAPVGLLTGFSLVLVGQMGFVAINFSDENHVGAAVFIIVLLGFVAAVAAHSERGRHSLATGFALGVLGVGLTVFTSYPSAWWVCVAAAVMVVVVFISAENRRFQVNHEEHLAQRGELTEF